MNSGKIVKMHALKPKPGGNTIFITSGAQRKPRATTLKIIVNMFKINLTDRLGGKEPWRPTHFSYDFFFAFSK